MGKIVTQKENALKGHPNLPKPFQMGGDIMGRPYRAPNFIRDGFPTALPWAANGVPLRGDKEA